MQIKREKNGGKVFRNLSRKAWNELRKKKGGLEEYSNRFELLLRQFRWRCRDRNAKKKQTGCWGGKKKKKNEITSLLQLPDESLRVGVTRRFREFSLESRHETEVAHTRNLETRNR